MPAFAAFAPPLPARARPAGFLAHAPLAPRRPRIPPRATPATRPSPAMLFDALAENLSTTLRQVRGRDTLTEKNVAAALKEIKRALLEADVNLRVVNGLLKEVKKRAIGSVVVDGVEPGQMLVKIMYEELAQLMGGTEETLIKREDGQPTVVLMAGLQGAGKTTACAKLALACQKEGRDVLMVPADVYRPAAVEQLNMLGERVGVPVFDAAEEKDVVRIVKMGVEQGRQMRVGVVIVDTAGRQVVDDKLMNELENVKKSVTVDETLLVVDAMTGQEAANVTRMFDQRVGITGSILTKLDGDTRGGAALSVRYVSGKPIKFVGTGEKLDKLDVFYPERMAGRILGMGDVVSFVEKAQEQMDLKEAEKMTKKMMQSKFDFEDFLKQTKMISNMGSFGGMMKMMPGMSGQLSDTKLAEAEKKLKVADSMIKSMTKQERTNPDLLYASSTANSRLNRIAKGSGRSLKEAKNLIGDFQKMRTMMQRMSRQMMGGLADGKGDAMDSMVPPQPTANRAQRRRAAKKKAIRGTSRRGFG